MNQLGAASMTSGQHRNLLQARILSDGEAAPSESLDWAKINMRKQPPQMLINQ